MGCAFNQELKDQGRLDEHHRDRLSTVDCRKKSTKVVDIII